MRAGKLQHPVVFQSPPAARNEYGEEEQDTDDWTVFARRRVAIIPLTGRELWNAQQSQPDVTHRVEMRYLEGLTTKKRMKYGTRIFNILSVLNLEEDGREMHLICVERV